MLPSLRDWIFSAKTFASALLALWIALRMGLDRPYWAMATAYIVAQPLTGAMRSKAAYRFYGTLLGAVACLVFIPNFVDAPVLLIAALSLWIGGCIYFAVLDRSPRSYVFLLAGYSVALIGFPIVDAPDTVWDVVLARVEEITLGIVCTTVIGSIVFPIPLGPALTARLDNWIRRCQPNGLWASYRGLQKVPPPPRLGAKSPAMPSRSRCWQRILPTIRPICRPLLCRWQSCTSASSYCCPSSVVQPIASVSCAGSMG